MRTPPTRMKSARRVLGSSSSSSDAPSEADGARRPETASASSSLLPESSESRASARRDAPYACAICLCFRFGPPPGNPRTAT
jgi:hypothetical protein